MYIIVDLNANTYAITLADAKATGEDDFILDVMLCNGIFKQINDFSRTLEMAGGTNTNLNN